MNQVTFPLPEPEPLKKWALRAVAFLVVAYVAYVVREIWVPLLLAFLLATLLDPIVDRLELKGWTRGAAATLIYVGFLVVAIGGSFLAYPHLANQVQDLQAGIAKHFPDTTPPGVKQALYDMGTPSSIVNPVVRFYKGLVEGASQSNAAALEYVTRIGTNLIWMIIIPIVAFYALLDYHLLLAKGLLLVPRKHRDLVQAAAAESTGIFAKYLRAMLIVSVLNGLATWALLTVLGIPSALIIGIMAVIAYNVPYIGAIAINLLTAGVAFLHGGTELMLLATGLGLVMHHIVFDQIIAPRFLGGQVGLHPILSIIALLIGNILLGILGMIFAVPVAACIQIGVLALVPKLGRDIDIQAEPGAPSEIVSKIAGEVQDVHAKIDATEELHRSVSEAVDSLEDKLEGESPEAPAPSKEG